MPVDDRGDFIDMGLVDAAKAAMALCVKDIVLDNVNARLGAWGGEFRW